MSYPVLLKLGLSMGLFIVYLLVLALINKAVKRFGIRQEYIERRIVYIRKVFTQIFLLITLFTWAFIWGIDFRAMLIFTSSFFAVMGIALFASWSILSNLTAGMFIFFSFPYRINDQIRVVDGENSIEGTIYDMTLFHIKIMDETGHFVFYPNNLVIQKPITKLNLEDLKK